MPATFVKQLTGPGTRSEAFDFRATDLGYCALAPDRSRLMTIYGDTFRGARVGAGEWLSPVLTYSSPNSVRGGLDQHSAFGGQRAAQLLPYGHNVGGISTVLPGGLITVGDKSYLFAVVSTGYPNVRSTEIQVTTGDGSVWKHSGTEWPADWLGGHWQMFAPVDWGDGFVYIFSTGFQRNKGIILHRVPRDRILDKSAYVPWGWTSARGWAWGQPASIIWNVNAGEITAAKIGNDLVVGLFNGSNGRVELKVMTSPTDNMITAPVYTVVDPGKWPGDAGNLPVDNWSAGVVAQPYAGHIIPGSTHDEVHVVVSQWKNQNRPATDGWPYLSLQFKLKINPRNPLPQSPKEFTVAEDAAPVYAQLVGTDKVRLHEGRLKPDGTPDPFDTGSMREMLKSTAFEQTLWLKQRGLAGLRTDYARQDTNTGHSVRSSSHGAIVTELMVALCEASGVDVRTVLGSKGLA